MQQVIIALDVRNGMVHDVACAFDIGLDNNL